MSDTDWPQLDRELYDGDLAHARETARVWLTEARGRWGANTVVDLRRLRLAADVLLDRADAGDRLARDVDRCACEIATRLTGTTVGGDLRLLVDDDPVDRAPGPGWHQIYTAWEAIGVLATGRVVALHLDHDLADEEAGLGRHITAWLAGRQRAGRVLWPGEIRLHTANGAGRSAMDADVMGSAPEHFDVDRREAGSQIRYLLAARDGR